MPKPSKTIAPLLAGLAVVASTLPIGFNGAQAQEIRSPSILLVIADDMGLDVSPCYNDIGADKPDMPVLESLCENGLVFDNAWANPTCSPTRASILTGRYGFRTGVLAPAGAQSGIRPDERSIQRLLNEEAPTDYAHAVIGKWHLSDRSNGDADNPEVMGVGFYSGLIRGAMRDYYRVPLTTNGELQQVDGYATTMFTDIAIDWLIEQGEPWFLWLAYNAPHTPFHVPPTHLHDRELVDDENAIRADPRPYYLAALEALDTEMGRLLASLEPAERENTLIIFIGDNGTPGQVAEAPYQRQTAKGTLFPGGVSVPFIVAGAGVGRTGEREAALVNTVDIFATIADVAGAGPDQAQDGISFRPLLTDTSAPLRDFVYSELRYEAGERGFENNGWTIRKGNDQLMVLDTGELQLFDVAADPAGTVNRLEQATDASQQLAEDLRQLGETLRQ